MNKAVHIELPREIRRALSGWRALFVHGSSRRNNEYLYEDRPEESLRRLLAPLGINCLVLWHTHLPYHHVVGDVHIVNVGSTGKPKEGDPRAFYAFIDF